ncbi:MAG TPA: GNAT family N-acetyltransferase [Pseudonocardiaceae bacterium]
MAPTDAVAYLTVRDGRGRLLAVLPAYLPVDPDPLGRIAATFPEAAGERLLMTHSWHCYDAHIGGAAAHPAVVDAALTALRGHARDLGAAWCGVVNVRDGGHTAAALAAARYETRHLQDRYGADLTGHAGLADFLAAATRPRVRRELERHRRRAADHGAEILVRAPAEADLTGLTALCDATARRHGSDSFYRAGVFEPFVAALGPAATVIEVRQHGRLVTGAVCLLDRRRLHWWAGGVDYAVAGNFSPYYLLFGEAVRLALGLGRPDLEGGRGNPGFKLRHGLRPRSIGACLVRA